MHVIVVYIKVAIIDICFPAVPSSVSSVFSFYDLKLYCSCSISQNSTVMFLTTAASVKLNMELKGRLKKSYFRSTLCRKALKISTAIKKPKALTRKEKKSQEFVAVRGL